MDHTEEFDPQEIKNPAIMDVEIPIEWVTRKAPDMDNLL